MNFDTPGSPGNNVAGQATAEDLLAQANASVVDGDMERALHCLRRVIDEAAQAGTDESVCGQALERLCSLYQRRGQMAPIREACQAMLAVFPGYLQGHYLLAAASQTLGDAGQALAHYQRVLAGDPDHAAAHFNCALLLEQQQRYREALVHYQRVVALRPQRVQAHLRLGMLAAQRLRRPDIAREAFRQAATLAPDDAGVQFNLAVFWHQQRDFEAAAACYDRVLALDPGHAISCYLLADICEMSNRLNEAEQYLARGQAIDPDCPLAPRLSATLMRRRGRVDEAIALLSAVTIPDDDHQLAQDIHFELGRLYDRAGDSERAYGHFQAGNALLARGPGAESADKDGYLARIRSLRQQFSPAWLASWRPLPEAPVADDEPVFLVGFPRSGTTLLDQILDSHPTVQVIEEQELIGAVRARLSDYPQSLATIGAGQVAALREQYLAAARGFLRPGAGDRIVDKMPLNIIDIGLIVRLFPGARIILALRHPCDCCLSGFMQSFLVNDAMASFSTLDDATRLYAEVMSLWQVYRQRLPLNVHQVRYEDLVDDLEGEARRLLDFLGLEWDDRVLSYNRHARERKLITTPSYNQVTERIYTRARYRWQRYAAPLAPWLPRLAPFIEDFGYPPTE